MPPARANWDPYSGCALDHAPRECPEARAVYLRKRQDLSDRFEGGGFPVDVSKLSDEVIEKTARACVRLRKQNANAIHNCNQRTK